MGVDTIEVGFTLGVTVEAGIIKFGEGEQASSGSWKKSVKERRWDASSATTCRYSVLPACASFVAFPLSDRP